MNLVIRLCTHRYASVVVLTLLGAILSLTLFNSALLSVQALICVLELSYFAYEDIKDRAISTLLALIGIVANLGFIYLSHGADGITEGVVSFLIIGVGLALIVLLTKQLGMGDALVIGAIAILIGWGASLLILFISVLLVLISFILQSIIKKNKEMSFPFLAYAQAGLIITLLFT